MEHSAAVYLEPVDKPVHGFEIWLRASFNPRQRRWAYVYLIGDLAQRQVSLFASAAEPLTDEFVVGTALGHQGKPPFYRSSREPVRDSSAGFVSIMVRISQVCNSRCQAGADEAPLIP